MEIKNYNDFLRYYDYDADTDRLGEGGYGTVYKAYDNVRQQYVAIKVSQVRAGQPYSLQREVEVANQLPKHPNIAFYEGQCYRLKVAGIEFDFAVMQYYPEGNLADYVRQRKLQPEMLPDLVRGIMGGVAHLHRHSFIHRDLKPANILIALDKNGKPIPKIADFGIAKISDDGASISNGGIFSLQYMSPEQALFEKLDYRTDIWSLGALLHFILTDTPPYLAEAQDAEKAMSEIRAKIIKNELPTGMERMPQPFGEIVRRCLVKDRNLRAQSVTELLALLDNPNPPKANTNAGFDVEATVVFEKPKPLIDIDKTVLLETPKQEEKQLPEPVKPKTEPPPIPVKKEEPVKPKTEPKPPPEVKTEPPKKPVVEFVANTKTVSEKPRRKKLYAAMGAGGLVVLVLGYFLFFAGDGGAAKEKAVGDELRRVVRNWVKAHNEQDTFVLSSMYADTMELFYASYGYSGEKAVNKIIENLKETDGYNERDGYLEFASKEIEVVKEKEGLYSCYWRRSVYGKNKLAEKIYDDLGIVIGLEKYFAEIPICLVFKQVDNSWEIVVEVDSISYHNAKKQAVTGAERLLLGIGVAKVNGDYPFTAHTELTINELQYFDKDQIRIMRNEIFARYGYNFGPGDLDSHFKKQSWYVPRTEDFKEMDTALSKIELTNVTTIRAYEKDMKDGNFE